MPRKTQLQSTALGRRLEKGWGRWRVRGCWRGGCREEKFQWDCGCRNFVLVARACRNMGLRRSLGHGARPVLAAVSRSNEPTPKPVQAKLQTFKATDLLFS